MQARFSTAQMTEFQRRAALVTHAMRDQGVSQLLVTHPENIYWLTGATFEALERPFFLLLRQNGQRRLLVPTLEADHLGKAWGLHADDILRYREFPAPDGQSWIDALLQPGVLDATFAYEDSTPASMAAVLNAEGGRALDVLSDLRMIKSAFEIALIATAARYADWGVAQILRNAYDGVRVAETFMPGQQMLRKIIRETPDWDPLTTKVICGAWPAPLSAEPHAIPALAMRLEAGPHVAMVLTRVNGYAAESERTFFTQTPNAEEAAMFDLMLSARALAFSMLRPGVAGAAIDEAVNAFLATQGCGDFHLRLHRCGHGFGLGNHEPPWIASGSPHILQENMLVSIEPGIYLPGQGGYRHSDTVLITADGYRCLTTMPTAMRDLLRCRRSLRHRVQGWAVGRSLGLSG